MNEFYIGKIRVAADEEPLVIAEIGINHEGSLDVAIEMADAAFHAGAKLVKHQTHIVEDEMSDEARKITPGNSSDSIYEIMERCALNKNDEIKLMRYVQAKGMEFISTPFSRAAAYRLASMDVPAYKIGSGECNNYPLVRLISSFGKPIILSTGMNDIESVKKSVQIMRQAKIKFALLHCTNIYPTPYHLVRLGGIKILQKNFPDAIIGLSDHTVDNYACFGAVALGARILERHFTDSYDRQGPDIKCSMDGRALADLIAGSKAIFHASGGDKKNIPEERVTQQFAFASVVADRDIKKGEQFTEDNIWVKRPGTGEFSADDYDFLLGKYALSDFKKGQQIKKNGVSKMHYDERSK